MTLVAMKRAGMQPDRDLIFLATADEESGGEKGAKWMFQHHYDKLDPEYTLDEGGFGSRDVLAPGRLVYGISVADKRPFWWKLSVEGPSGHGSQPTTDNANEVLLAALGRILAAAPPPSEAAVVRTMRERLGGSFAANKFTNAIQRNTCALTTLRAGVGDPPKVNVIPSRSEATLDCRLLPGEPPEEFEARLKTLAADPRVKWERLHLAAAGGPSSWETSLYRTMERVLRRQQQEGGPTVVPIIVPYGTDGQNLRSRGVHVYGFVPMIADLATISSMHSDQESIPAAEFQRALRVFYEIIYEFTGGQP
jgi:acetylornithine deacetylase/succinyl-diaminopimelate desuccinylase-like protein